MKTIRRVIVALCISVVIGSCGSAIQGGKGKTGAEESAGQNGTQSAVEKVEPGASTYDAPPLRFQPRSFPPHTHPVYAQAPDLNALPKFKAHLGECYPEYSEPEAQIAQPQRRAYKMKGAAGGGGATQGIGGVNAPAKAARLAAPSTAPVGAATLEALPSAAEEMKVVAADRAREAEPTAQVAKKKGAEQARGEEEAPAEYNAWGAKIYLSNDDSMSLSSAQRVIFAIDNFLPLPLEHIRPHELLNYFSFETAEVRPDRDFSVLADIAPDPREKATYSLALSVLGRPVDRASRRNAAITWVIDRSGSMEDQGKIDYVRRGLRDMVNELKTGDMVNMVLFDDEVCTPFENFVVGRDEMGLLVKAIDAIRPRNSTDLHRGLSLGYEIADRVYQSSYSNRVIIITDAMANTGVVDEDLISVVSKYYDSRKIRLSGIGVGREFNDSLLDKLTERGKGAYVFLGSEAEVDAVFGRRFISLIETTALDVHFRLHLPKSLRMKVFYGEESSTVKEDVQAIHYFANTSQLFLSDLEVRGGKVRPQDDIMLTIEYEDPESAQKQFEEYAFNLGEISGEAYNVKKGRLLMAWIDILAQMAARPMPAVYENSAGAWQDPEGWEICDRGRQELVDLGKDLERDVQVRRVFELWDKYCSRYERPRNPVRRNPVSRDDSWPSAQSPAGR